FAIAELARPMPPNWSPLPAVGASLVAGVLDPSFIALPAIAGIRFLRGPWPQPRGSVALPLAGILGIGLAVLAALAHDGMFADLWLVWSDRAQAHAPLPDVLARMGDLLGPISAVAAAAGIANCATRGMFAASSVVGVAAGAIAVDLVTGEVGTATPIVAALGAGVAISRLTAMVRWPAGQAFVGGVVGFMLVVAPALALAVR
ncbi:MAG: hypothetical protein HOV81_42945, partial [Kofleriaceae bacterium]|nr:hypothetical protein [Kofleriaceae bacterium]